MRDTRAFFIVSSGRSGTAMLHKAMSGAGDIEMHHEYMVHIVQPLAVRRYQGLADAAETRRVIAQTHEAARYYSAAAHWGDSSNKLSWLVPDLAAVLPDAKFVHLTRDGRKVASSYFHKLGDECYDDASNAALATHLADPARVSAPPPEKKYWWPQPPAGHSDAARFASSDQFARIAWHWAEINRVAMTALDTLPAARRHFVRLEDLAASPDASRTLHDFLGLPWSAASFDVYARPHNVNRPEDKLLTPEQRTVFDDVAGGMMERLGYAGMPEYVVKY